MPALVQKLHLYLLRPKESALVQKKERTLRPRAGILNSMFTHQFYPDVLRKSRRRKSPHFRLQRRKSAAATSARNGRAKSEVFRGRSASSRGGSRENGMRMVFAAFCHQKADCPFATQRISPCAKKERTLRHRAGILRGHIPHNISAVPRGRNLRLNDVPVIPARNPDRESTTTRVQERLHSYTVTGV